MTSASPMTVFGNMSDEVLVQCVLAGNKALFEILMRRHNQRIYRVARAVLRNDTEAEDVMQDAYVRAFEHLKQFEARSSFSTWLSRIAFNEALARVRKQKRFEELDVIPENKKDKMAGLRSVDKNPEENASNAEIRRLLEKEVIAMPENYRTVFMLREVEEIHADEVAQILGITAENVKMRLFRARAFLRKRLLARAGGEASNAFLFHADRCDQVVNAVFEKLGSRD